MKESWHCAQHGVVRSEVPDGRDVGRGLQWVGREEIVVLQEITAHLWRKEDNETEDSQKNHDAYQVFYRVVGVEGNTVQRVTGHRVCLLLDLYTIRVVRAHFVQRHQVDNHQ